MTLSEIAEAHQQRVDRISDAAAARAVRLYRRMNPAVLDVEWQFAAESITLGVVAAQVRAVKQAPRYVASAARDQGVDAPDVTLYPESFAGVTKEGRDVAAELFSAVTVTKGLIRRGTPVPAAFRAGAGLMSVIAANVVRDAARSADATVATAAGFRYSIRVINPGACSRCAILAGVKGYRTSFQRHPRCRCYSMPLAENAKPTGMFASPDDYFESLSPGEQDRIFTKSGAEAIRLGADPMKVVNARRGAYRSARELPDGSFGPSRLRPLTIGKRADGSPLQVYATTEGTTARSAWARRQNDLQVTGERYRRTQTVRLMPEQIISMSPTPERARELLARYGYID